MEESVTYEQLATVVEQCVRLECRDCDRGECILDSTHDKNLYHANGSPCKAYRIRRHYNDLRAYEQSEAMAKEKLK